MNESDEQLVRAYRMTFLTPAGEAVIYDLMQFCRFRTDVDSPIDEGKRRVFVRIMNLLNFTPEQLAATYRGQSTLAPNQENDDGS